MNAIKLIIYTFNSYKISRVCLHRTAIPLSIPLLVHREEGFNEIVSFILPEPHEPNENYPPLKSWDRRGPQITTRLFAPCCQCPRNRTSKVPTLQPWPRLCKRPGSGCWCPHWKTDRRALGGAPGLQGGWRALAKRREKESAEQVNQR